MGEHIGTADHVINGVYISGATAIRSIDNLLSAGVKHVLKLYSGVHHWTEEFTVFDNAIEDNVFIPENVLKTGVTFIQEQVQVGNKVLVSCAAGISRSSTFVLAYLLEQDYELEEAWELLVENHPQADPMPQMWRSLIVHYDLPYTLEEVQDWHLE